MNTLQKNNQIQAVGSDNKTELWAIYGMAVIFVIMMALCMFLIMGLGSPQLMTAPIPVAPWL
ncbi:MAG: hypothetical protein K2X81_19095 [Candidatus Obscuribacterales bacterium]|nr:hypothetical protein [Candidatus Obscuribacterales bacterium]